MQTKSQSILKFTPSFIALLYFMWADICHGPEA
jgi:hypothetical protein